LTKRCRGWRRLVVSLLQQIIRREFADLTSSSFGCTVAELEAMGNSGISRPQQRVSPRQRPTGSRNRATSRLAVVLPVRATSALPVYWEGIFEALEERDVQVEFIPATMPLTKTRWPVLGGRVSLPPPTSFVRALFRSPARVFLCAEYSLATLLSAVVARLTRRRTIIFQEHRGREGFRLPWWERRYRQLLGALAHAFVANTDAAYMELADDIRIDRRKIFRATLLVPPERAALCQEVHPAPDSARRPLFLFVGQLIERKNVGSLVDAAAALRARGFEFEVWIVGEGVERSELEMRAGEMLREGVVRFLGSFPRTAIGTAYEAADIFVMPSLRDYRSVAVLEALRFGKPVIDSARDGNASDFVRHEQTGLVFDPYEPGALEAAMERAIAEPDTVRHLGRRASELMEKQTPQSSAAALRKILEAVAPR
jgi:glycosyltransferase involved in cell wall biosynthesis